MREGVDGDLLIPRGGLSPAIFDEYERPVAEVFRPSSEVEEPLGYFVGVPFDTAILGRRGAKSGPEAVRQSLNMHLAYEPNWEVDLSEAPRIADVGDVDVMHTDIDATWERVTTVVGDRARRGKPFVVVGGDHGLTFPIIRGAAQAVSGNLGVISVDAHFDVRISHHGEKSSGVPFRYMLENMDGKVRGRNFVEFGIGGWLNTKMYHDYLKRHEVRVITQREIARGDLDALVGEALATAADGTDGVWMTVDIDGIDGAVVDATNVPAVGGLSPFQVRELVWAFARSDKAIGMDVMEVSPGWSSTTLTERMAAFLVLDFFAGRYVTTRENG